MTPFRREIERMFSGWPRIFDIEPATMMTSPPIELSETDEEVIVKAQVPGMKKEDLDVEVLDGNLNIRGETKQKEEEKKANLYRSEFRYGAFSRTVPLPSGVEPSKAKAKLEEGVLELHVPKTEEARKHSRRIEIA